MSILDINLILASFGGGVFGAALGPIVAFIFCGVLGLSGITAVVLGNTDILNVIAFGPYFGPHISFGSAVVATAYAGNKELLHGGKDLLTPLYKFRRFDVLLVGGLFGVLSYLVNGFLAETNIPVDTIALTVVIANILGRLIFGKSGLFGNSTEEIKIKINSSIVHFNLLLGFSVGLISSYATSITESLVIGYAISATILIFLYFDEFPVTHHVSISAAYATLATSNILVGGIFGILAIFLGEMVGNLFNSMADTYIDPPAVVIALLSAVVSIFLQ
ncbi:hypothetical protein QBE52_10985 [Clostridiaceae bacterium 35-E11]